MKRIIALALIICMLVPVAVTAAETADKTKVYIFGDDWAAAWGEELKGYVYNGAELVNAAGKGALLSKIKDNAAYGEIKTGDTVVLSYGILEKDRPGDKNSEFRQLLDKTAAEINKKGAHVIFASICSTMRYNTLTGQLAETKNFYTETTRAFAKEKGIEYVDLSELTASAATAMGVQGAGRLYVSSMELTKNGNRMCAYEVFKALYKAGTLQGKLKLNLSQVYEVQPGERSKSIDVFFEKDVCDTFALYIKGGSGVTVNGASVENGNSTCCTKAQDGKINVSFSACEMLQVTPLYRIDAEDHATGQTPFEKNVMPGIFDVTVRKTEPLKASVYLNGYLIASNLDMPGTQKVEEPAEHTFGEYTLTEDKISVTVTGLTDKLDYISLRESAVIYDERPRIFIGGDSTVCNYYPLRRTGNEEDGTVMTGWGMMLDRFVDADVINLAASGDWAENWLEKSFPVVEKEGQPGDIFVVQFGINDHDKSSIPAMKNALGEMIDRCAAKGIIPILVSPQISAGYGWGDASDIGKSDGGAYGEFFDAVGSLADEKGCFYVDLTDLSAGWFSEIGRDRVYREYHLWDYENNKPKDMMHLSFKGADTMCRFFILGLQKIKDSNLTDKWGNTLSFLKIW